MRIPTAVFKIAVDLVEQQLSPQTREPVDLPHNQIKGTSALRFLGHSSHATATEPAPKVVTDSGKQVEG